ncbi:MAG: dihydroneopterin aldolase [Polyangia bacterium]
MDFLFLEGLEVPCRVGCTPPERMTPQSLRCDVRLYCGSLQRAGQTDDLEATIDYRIATDMIAAVQKNEFLLIERVAEVMAAVALAHPLVDEVQVTVRKRPPVQGLEIAGVQITRSRA